ncbi:MULTISPECIES: hypothetical protein [Thiorhodovibrio]|uniref:hypothetical protein n=1 Tax=Thiorhodovibrio TaxID=61593 RepID=UPI001912B83C|nr:MULTISPECIES: hypothetical protein [Thiorhodovibrio]WPL14061.1 hypothetical protein Thiosp_03893 [Thiorhodovibrio litoralis]
MLNARPSHPPPETRSIRRYSAFFRTWAQAFGEHELIEDPDNALRWLIGPNQLGFILNTSLRRQLYALLLGRHAHPPPRLRLTRESLQLGQHYWMPARAPEPVYQLLQRILANKGALHLFQSYHLIFPAGTRILTLSQQAPMPLIYREIAAVELEVDAGLLGGVTDAAAVESPGPSD